MIAIIGLRLTELRRQRGWTQKELGNRLALSGETISKYERGAMEPPDATKIRLARLFNVSLDYLLGITDEPQALDKQDYALPRYFPADELSTLNDFRDFLIYKHDEQTRKLLALWPYLSPRQKDKYLKLMGEDVGERT